MIDHSKIAIKNGSVFSGLDVPDLDAYRTLFLQPQFKLWSGEGGHCVFEENAGGFIFHLFNFTKIKTRHMSEHFIYDVVIPYCQERGLTFIQASAERKGMAKKLARMGFQCISGNVWRREVQHVL